MVLQRWDPFNELRQMQETMDRMWRGLGRGPAREEGIETWAVPLDVVQEGDNIVVKASMPGVKPEDIEVTIDEGVLTIKGTTKEEREEREGNYLMRERREGRFHRALRLPETVDTENAAPRYENGVLTIAFPKVEARKAKKLDVTAG